jgi:hypothetical protein
VVSHPLRIFGNRCVTGKRVASPHFVDKRLEAISSAATYGHVTASRHDRLRQRCANARRGPDDENSAAQ